MKAVKCLIVDDEAIIANDLKLILEMRGFKQVEIAYSGKSAIETADSFNPDILLMDINLNSNMDGIDVVHIIRRNHPIPVIFMSAHSDQKTMSRIQRIQNAVLLNKPFGIIMLDQALQYVLNLGHSQHGSMSKRGALGFGKTLV